MTPNLTPAPPIETPKVSRPRREPPRSVWQLILIVWGVVGFQLFCCPAQAMDMQEVFDAVNAQGNYTNPAVLHGQSQSLYTGGNLFMRMPQRNYQLMSMTPPSWNAGCGGIDIFLGGFSFLNADKLIQMMRNIGQNAVGYAFKLAIQNLCPTCDNVIQSLQQSAQEMNRFNIDSCEAAQGMVNAAFSTIQQRNKQNSAKLNGVGNNEYPDYAGAWDGVRNNEQKADQVLDDAVQSHPELENALPRGNIVWKALSKLEGVKIEQREMLMSLVGTVIFSKSSQPNEPKIRLIDPTGIDLEALVGNPYEGSELPILRCDSEDCLHPSLRPMKVQNFSQMVLSMVQQISEHIASRQGYPNLREITNFLNVTDLPIYKMVAVHSRLNNAELAETLNSANLELIAARYAEVYLKRALGDVQSALQHLDTVSEAAQSEQIKQLLDRIRSILAAAERKSAGARQRASGLYGMAQQALFVERANNGQLLSVLSQLRPGKIRASH